jgi:hypothetical protein
MSLEAAVPILHAGDSGLWSSGVDLETTPSPGSSLSVQAAFFLGTALLAPHGEGRRKGDLTKARLLTPKLAYRSQRASHNAVKT